MKKLTIIVIATLAASVGCSDGRAALEVKPGSTVTLQKKDGVTVSGRLIEVKPEHLVVETRTGRTEVRRAEVTTLKTDSTSALNDVTAPAVQPVGSIGREPGDAVVPAVNAGDAPRADGDDADRRAASVPEYREVTLPAGTVLPVELTTRVGSEISSVEDAVRGTLRRPVVVGGVQAFPAGTAVIGHVTAAERSARVKGRARIAFRFTTIDPPGDAAAADHEDRHRVAPGSGDEEAGCGEDRRRRGRRRDHRRHPRRRRRRGEGRGHRRRGRYRRRAVDARQGSDTAGRDTCLGPTGRTVDRSGSDFPIARAVAFR